MFKSYESLFVFYNFYIYSLYYLIFFICVYNDYNVKIFVNRKYPDRDRINPF